MGRHTGPKDINAAERQRRALLLRREGHDYDEIGKRLGYADKSGAWRAVTKALKQIPQSEATELRTLINSRYDALLTVYLPKALAGNFSAAYVVLKVEEQRARLLGLDIAPETQVTGPELIVTEIPSGYLSGPREQEVMANGNGHKA